MRTSSLVSRSKYQILMYASISRVEPKRLLGSRAPRATPRIRPDWRSRKLTSRSPSPSGYVRRTIASDSLSGIHFVGAPTDRDFYASRFAPRNFKFVTYHTTPVESIENRKKSLFLATSSAKMPSDIFSVLRIQTSFRRLFRPRKRSDGDMLSGHALYPVRVLVHLRSPHSQEYL